MVWEIGLVLASEGHGEMIAEQTMTARERREKGGGRGEKEKEEEGGGEREREILGHPRLGGVFVRSRPSPSRPWGVNVSKTKEVSSVCARGVSALGGGCCLRD